MTPNCGAVVVALILVFAHHCCSRKPYDTHSVYNIIPNADGTINSTTFNLEKHRNSALLLRLNINPTKLKAESDFTITTRAPSETGYHVSAVVESLYLRVNRFKDTYNLDGTILKTLGSPSSCIDYISVTSQSLPKSKICGSWSLDSKDELLHQGSEQNVIGNCHLRSGGNHQECHAPTQLHLNVHIGNKTQKPHQATNLSFEITITAFRHPDVSNPCNEDEFLCKDHNEPRCIWIGLLCDKHFNCGVNNNDEYACRGNKHQRFDMYPRQLSAFDIVLYSLVLFAMIAAFGVLFYWQKQIKKLLGIEIHALPVPTSEDGAGPRFLNSAGALENGLGNLGEPPNAISLFLLPRASENGRADNIPKNDRPPSYSSLFPDGPPTMMQSTPAPDEECYPYERVAAGATSSSPEPNTNTDSSQVTKVQ